ncbi:MAG: hypothetical protein ABSG69_02980 [Candidatus Acidiferrum sp.]|jgi:hypothetical protein
MSLHTASSGNEKHEESRRENKQMEPVFHVTESQDGAGAERAHVIAICIGLFIFAIVVSQFGRPSRARQAEFLRGAAKVQALGKTAKSAETVREVSASGADARTERARVAEEKELTPAVYASRKYGVAWQFPRTYVLRKGANAGLDLYGHNATASAMASAGRVTLATVIIPARVYAGTDFQMAALTARVNAVVSQAECGKFRRASSDTGDAVELVPSAETVGTIDFAEADAAAPDAGVADGDGLATGGATQEKFYHVYENEACYEFAMRVNTGDLASPRNSTRVDRDEVFDRLEEILTSVTIVPVRGGAGANEAHGN